PALEMLDEPGDARKPGIEARTGEGGADLPHGSLQELGRAIEMAAPRHRMVEIGEEQGPVEQLGVRSASRGERQEGRRDLLGGREDHLRLGALEDGTPGRGWAAVGHGFSGAPSSAAYGQQTEQATVRSVQRQVATPQVASTVPPATWGRFVSTRLLRVSFDSINFWIFFFMATSREEVGRKVRPRVPR